MIRGSCLLNYRPPVIFHADRLKAVAVRFKNSLHENSKMCATVEEVIEACHNAIVAWENQSYMQPLLLEELDDHLQTKEHWNILKEYLTQNAIRYKEIFAIKGNILSKLVCLIYLFDYASIYRGILSGISPSPTKSIDFIKGKLSSCTI